LHGIKINELSTKGQVLDQTIKTVKGVGYQLA
jgi:hypothetical protein